MKAKQLLPSKMLIKYSVISALSFVIDFALFTAIHLLCGGLFLPMIVARLVSGGFNFYQNKITVYKAQQTGKVRREMISYVALAVLVFVLGYVFISIFVLQFGVNIILAKVIVDVLLFLGNYLVQKWVIFRS